MNLHPVKSIFFALAFCFLVTPNFAQFHTQFTVHEPAEKVSVAMEAAKKTTISPPPYQLSFKKEASLLSVAIATQIAGIYVLKGIEPLNLKDIDLLNPEIIGTFDRNTIRHFSSKAHATSDILLQGSLTFPFLLMADKNMRKDFLIIGVMASEAFLLNAGVTTMVKGSVQRTRPYAYNPLVPIEDKMTKTAKTSFFSGHTSATAAFSFFTAKIYADYHPNSQWKPVVWTVAAVVPATTGYLRYRAGKHFPTDVLVGYGVGAAIGILIPHLHQSNNKKHFKLSPMTSNDAVGLTLRGVF